jgi:hypothetical protein
MPIPALESVQANPDLIERLPSEVIAALYSQAASVEAILRARLLALNAVGQGQPMSIESERALHIEEAARLLNTSADSLYRKWPKLPFAYKDPLDGKIKFSLRGIERYIASRAGAVRR